MQIARIPYLNTKPFFSAAGEDHLDRITEESEETLELVDMVPSELGRMAREGRVDAGLLPLVDYFALERRYERLGDFGIAVKGRVESVLLLSERPPQELDGCKIGITEETSTSHRLLRLLLEGRYGIKPADYLRGERDSVDACLLIGDEALAATAKGKPAPLVYDLAEEWEAWQGLPFVFAVWVARKELSHLDKARIASMLDRSLFGSSGPVEEEVLAAAAAEGAAVTDGGFSVGNLSTSAIPRGASKDVITSIVASYRKGPAARKALGPARRLEGYLDRFIYRLGPTEEAAIALFRRLLEENGIG